jgi:Tetracyclin repressor-like, C-terminal domain
LLPDVVAVVLQRRRGDLDMAFALAWCSGRMAGHGMTDEQWMTAHERTFAALFAARQYRRLSNITAQADVDLDLDTLFEFGLERMLDGYAALIQDTPK